MQVHGVTIKTVNIEPKGGSKANSSLFGVYLTNDNHFWFLTYCSHSLHEENQLLSADGCLGGASFQVFHFEKG
jgi:hypothetical protein